MKRLFFLLTFLSIFSSGFSQNINDEIEILRGMAETERKALIVDNMQFTEEESKIFWPLYDEYRAEAQKLGTEKITVVKTFADNYEGMTNETAINIMNDFFKIKQDEIKIRTQYRDKMLKTLNGKLVMRFMQIENKINAIIDFTLAQEIPLIIKK